MDKDTEILKPTPHHSKSHLNLALTMTGAVLLVLLVIIFLQNQQLKQELNMIKSPPKIQITSLTSPTLSPAIDPTSYWKTYRDKIFGFEFKYPSEWTDKYEFDSFQQGNLFYAAEVGTGKQEGERSGMIVSIPIQTNLDAEKYTQLNYYTKDEDKVVESSDRISQKKVGNLNFTKLLRCSLGCAEIYTIVNKGYVYSLNFIAEEKTIDQILSTFKFTDGSQSNEKIIDANFTQDCSIVIKTSQSNIRLITGFGQSKNSRCYQFAYIRTSPSGQFVAFQDLSGGIDSKISLYSLERKSTFGLGVYGTSNVFGLEFLPNDKLAVLTGYKDTTTPEESLTIFDIPTIISHISANFPNPENLYGSYNLEPFMTRPDLTGLDHVYEFLSITTDSLYLKDNQGVIGKKFDINKL